jgi:hypothetical protein
MLRDISPLQWIGIVIVAVLLAKKLIKWAITLGALVVLYMLNQSGALDGIKSSLGL